MIEKVKPSWLAWDSISCTGECIRCGTAIGAHDDERPDAALARHIDAHEGCTEETARELARERERSKIRASLERSRLIVDPSAGIALRDPVDPGVLSALVTDERLRRSDDPSVQSALGKALVALGELHREVKRKGWAPNSPTPFRKDRKDIVAGSTPLPLNPVNGSVGFAKPRLPPGKAWGATIEAPYEFDSLSHAQIMLKGDRVVISVHAMSAYQDGAGAGYGKGYEDARQRELDRHADRQIEQRKAEMDLQFKAAALEKMLRSLDPAMLLGQKQAPKSDSHVVAIPIMSRGDHVPAAVSSVSCGHPDTIPGRAEIRGCVRQPADGAARIVDVKLPYGAVVTSFRVGDIEFVQADEMTTDSLMKHCAALARERPFRLWAGLPFTITLLNKTIEPIQIGTVEILVEIEKPSECGCGRVKVDGKCPRCGPVVRTAPRDHYARDRRYAEYGWQDATPPKPIGAAADNDALTATPITEGSCRGGFSDAPRLECLQFTDAGSPALGCFCTNCELARDRLRQAGR